jgi:hypothetical protein
MRRLELSICSALVKKWDYVIQLSWRKFKIFDGGASTFYEGCTEVALKWMVRLRIKTG